MLQKILIIVLLFLVAFLAVTKRPQQTDPKIAAELHSIKLDVAKIKITNARLDALESEIEELKSKVAKRRSREAPLRPIKATLNGSHVNDPFMGPSDAPILLMAFSNYQCLPCRQFARGALSGIKKDYIDAGKVKFLFRDLPLRSNPQAFAAATLAHCAGEQGKYWEMHDLLFKNVDAVDKGELVELGKQLEGVDFPALSSCFLSRKYDAEITRDFEEAKEIGAKGAPCFIIAKNTKNSVLDGVFLRGAQPYPVFQRQIEQLLNR
jgi:protein-disulfide isomerase